ncbi:MAG TPA: SulP family inorganic anion transporter [Candidatus Limnocylindrales bacterium]|nr:SulP family inorganic anion transporter [Candidatus Limnocylindrales bacterium]
MQATTRPSGALGLLYQRIPALDSLRNYSLYDFRADLLAGLTVATVAVPQAMAYAIVAGLPPQYGLYTAIVMTAAGALFDSSRQLINGPTNAISIALLSALALVPPEARLQAAVMLSVLVGTIQIGITLLQLGDLTRYISHSVIVGFTVGASVLLVLDQLKNLLGMKAMGDPHTAFLSRFWETMTQGGPVHMATLECGLAAIAIVLLLRALKTVLGFKLFPELLTTVCVMAAAAAWLELDKQGVKLVGEIPGDLPHFALPVFDTTYLRPLASSALALATLGLLEAISMAKLIASVSRQKLDINQQCLSEGVANLTGSFFQCFPGSGSLTRSAINTQAGAVSQWSGVISAIAVAAIMMMFAPYARFIPKAAMAGILMLTAWKMIDWTSLRYHIRASRFDAVIVAVTAISAIAVSVEFCVLIGVFLSFLLTVPRTGHMQLTEFVVTPEGVIHERFEDDVLCGRIQIYGLEGEMFFGSATPFEDHLDTIEARIQPTTRAIVLRMKRVRSPDAVCMRLLDEHVARIQKRGVQVILVGVRKDLAEALDRTGLDQRLGETHIFYEQPIRHTSTQKGVQFAFGFMGDPCGTCPLKDSNLHTRTVHYSV